MAFAARLAGLTGDLVEALIDLTPKKHPQRFKRHRDSALQLLKSRAYLQTNHFEVKNDFNGLDERFRVNNRDELADALRERLDSLEARPAPWHADILSLLLQLSDQPTSNTRLEDLEKLGVALEDPVESLTWENIAAEDGWDQNEDIWGTINYGGSSDDEVYFDHSDDETSESVTDDTDEDVGKTARDLIVTDVADTALFESIREGQSWRIARPQMDVSGNTRKKAVSEAHVVREVLFMLQGLDTTLFSRKCAAIPSYQTSHLAWQTHKALLNTFSEFGRQLMILRSFVTQTQVSGAPHLEAFQDCIMLHLRAFEGKLSEVHGRLTCPGEDAIVSLMSLKSELTGWLEPLFALSGIVARLDQSSTSSQLFRPLELLFDGAGIAQLSGNVATYELLARIFVECFGAYLRPIRSWMDEGLLLPNDKTFFVCKRADGVALSDIWRDRYTLRTTSDGRLHAPNFLQPAVNRIVNAGKNIVVLKQLGQYTPDTSSQDREEPPLDYEAICPKGFELAPFSNLFTAAFDRWMQSKYRTTSSGLKETLFNKCHLLSALEGLQALYLMSNGAAAAAFCEDLFERIDRLEPRWYERYALTAIAHASFGSFVDPSRIGIQVDEEGRRTHPVAVRDSVRTALPHVQINYSLAWPVRMILTETSISHYRAIFTLLLQLRRASYVLQRSKLLTHYWTDHEHWEERALYYSSRNSLLWFCNTVQTYLSTLVLAPGVLDLKRGLGKAADVDGLIAAHEAFAKKAVDEACLGSRLTPIRECMLDLLDLAVRLEQQAARGDGDTDTTAAAGLRQIKDDFERRLRFLCSGLRSVARATSDSPSAKWETLAEMLQLGMAGVKEA